MISHKDVPELRIGTCSWKYDSWVGLIYSQRNKAHYLTEYAQRYSTVEIDQWFWSLFPGGKVKLPDPREVETYARSVPDDFRFTIKVPNSITLTHYYQKDKGQPLLPNPYFFSPDVFREFMARLTPLIPKLGALMFQFEYLNKVKMPDLQTFLRKLKQFLNACPPEVPYAIEIRNPNFLNPTYFQFLQEEGIAHVFLQGYYMPSIFPLIQQYEDILHSPVIIRLHGPDRKGIEAQTGKRWNQIIAPRDGELAALAKTVTRLRERGKQVYINVNNHYEGSAPRTIERFLKILGKQQ